MAKKFDPSKDIDKKEMERIAREAIRRQEAEKLERELNEAQRRQRSNKIVFG